MEFIGFCGVDCGKCPIFKATIDNDDALRIQCAKQFSQGRVLLRPEDIHCYGCHSDYRCTKICSLCEISRCAEMKDVLTCAECGNYPCSKIDLYVPQGTEARDRLDGNVPWRPDLLGK